LTAGGASLPDTQKDKQTVKQDNAARNEGKTRCENRGVDTVPAEQHKKGVIPKAKGGTGEPENGQVLCRDCNLQKGDKGP
jgi:5-methylcytosine-specific restriction endonuclease McrA